MNPSKQFRAYFILTILTGLFMSALAWAADAIVAPTTDELTAFITAIGGIKGAGVLAIVVLAVQGLALIFRTQLGKFAGIYQLLIVNGLTMVLGVVGLKMTTGMSWLAVLLNSQSLAMAQVYFHQVINQTKKKAEDAQALPAPATPSA